MKHNKIIDEPSKPRRSFFVPIGGALEKGVLADSSDSSDHWTVD